MTKRNEEIEWVAVTIFLDTFTLIKLTVHNQETNSL